MASSKAFRHSSRVPRRCTFHASASCVPIRRAGFSDDIGLCSTKPISLPRSCRISRSLSENRLASVELNRSRSLGPLQMQQAQDRKRQRALPASALPHQAQDLSPVDFQRKIAQDARLARIRDVQPQC